MTVTIIRSTSVSNNSLNSIELFHPHNFRGIIFISWLYWQVSVRHQRLNLISFDESNLSKLNMKMSRNFLPKIYSYVLTRFLHSPEWMYYAFLRNGMNGYKSELWNQSFFNNYGAHFSASKSTWSNEYFVKSIARK